jgi:hypothetical protein
VITVDKAVLILEYVAWLRMLEKAYYVSIGLALVSASIFAYLSFRCKRK